MRRLEAEYGHDAVVDALRAEAGAMRERLADGAVEHEVAELIEKGAARRLRETLAPSLRRVINATGVIVHTNLGRAPLADAAVARIAALARGYTNLEYDVAAGSRGRRDVHAERLICRLTGAEAAVVVNNNAAAIMLGLCFFFNQSTEGAYAANAAAWAAVIPAPPMAFTIPAPT